ncbi:MAG: ABC transporter substrate-binding protein [Candidatus Rokubacteria bacterium]|nr:ABC transporter substrate-binding protein [Candidatus Rokubacteria bacterium]
MNAYWSRRAMLVIALALVGVVAPGGRAVAGPPTEQLRTQIDRVIKTLEDPELLKEHRAVERRKAVRKIAEEIFDFAETAKRSLGRHWAARTRAERDEFVKLFANLMERSYISKIELYGGEKIGFSGDTVEGDIATVKSKMVTKGGSEVPIDYRMLKKGDRWLVYDVSIEGVSLVANYRTQFNKIIQTSSYQELVKKLKIKQEEFLEGDRQKRTSRAPGDATL